MPPIDRILSQYSNPIRSWPGEEDLDAEARANYEAANPPKLQTEGGSIDKGDLLPIVRYPEAKTSPSQWNSSSDVMRQLDDGWRIEPFSRLTAPFKSMAQAWREQPLLGPMVRPSQMHPEAFNQMSGDAMTVAGTGMTGGIGRAAVGPPVPHGVTELGIFGGRKAKTADLDALARAEEMIRIGRPREEVWSETGWFTGPDGKWRFEIDDSGNMMTGEGANYHPGRLRSEILDQAESREAGQKSLAANGYQGRLDQILDHKDAFAAYPDLAGTTWASVPGEKMAVPNVGGVWKGDRFGMEINADYSPRLQTGKSITLHELQHGIQDAENFSRGANVRMFEMSPEQIQGAQRQLTEVSEAQFIQEFASKHGLPPKEAAARIEQDLGRKPLDEAVAIAERYPPETLASREVRLREKIADASDPKSAYNRTAGEAEARLVQKRIDMTDAERRARPPWLDYDVPEKDQIVRFGNESGAMSNKPLDMSPEARLARAREMGFDTERKWYHGTRSSQPFEAFELGRPTHNNLGFLGNVETKRNAAFFSDNRDVSGSYGDNVGEYYLRGETADLDRIQHDFVDSLDAFGDRDVWMQAKHGRQPWRFFDGELGERFSRWAKDNGIDAVRFKEAIEDGSGREFEGTTVAVLNPSNIRSANADFDPNLSSSPTLMASIDPLTAAVSPPRQVDPLGYYSPTLDAALRLSQKKGTPEQMLAQLKKAGAKDSEIEVSGLKRMFEGKKSVSQEEIVKALEEGKIGLNEVRYGGSDAENRIELVGRPWDDGDGVQAQTIYLNDKEYTAYYDPDAGNAWAVTPDGQTIPGTGRTNRQDWNNAYEAIQDHGSRTGIPDDAAGAARFADYSLDPENPTYREVVLHLPATKNTLEQWKIRDEFGNVRATYSDEASARAQARQGQTVERAEPVTLDGGFRSGHFDEPNIVGHMMVSETRLPDSGARVLTLDQVQSDWGQKLRDGGVRDEGKVAALDAKWRDGFAALEAHRAQGPELRDSIAERYGLHNPGSANADGWLAARGREMELPAEALQQINAYFAQRNRLMNEHRLAEAELRTAQAATPGHPLVNTTDQWLNTTLRRAIRMASEEGQDYIAIPSGNTVLGYNPGQEKGMLGFYGGMPEEMSGVMSSLKQAATKAPNEPVINVLDPKTIDALAQAGILDKKKIEGISAARVLKNAESRFQGIVPKNLYALLQKLDKNTPPPQVIDTLDSPSGKTGLGEGFTLFKITPEAKKAAKEGGQPLFRFGGRVN